MDKNDIDITKYIVTSVLKEDAGRAAANAYNHFLSVPQQQLLSNLKNMDTIIFKILKKLLEINGGYLRLKNNVYHNIQSDTIVILKTKETSRISAASSQAMLEEEYPDVSRIAIVVFNASDEKVTIPESRVELFYGDSAFTYLFGEGGNKTKMKIKEEISSHMYNLANEFISTFS